MRRLRVLPAIACSLLLLAAGCGSPSATPAAQAPTTGNAASATAAPSSAAKSSEAAPAGKADAPKLVAGAEVDKAAFYTWFSAAMLGAKTYRSVSSSVTKQGGSVMQEVKSTTLVQILSVDKMNSRVTTTGPMGEMDFISIGDTSYIKLAGDTKYTKSTTSPTANPGGDDPMADAGEADLTGDGIVKIVYVGPDTVNGAPAYHFKQLMKPPSGEGQDVEAEIWLDNSGRMVKTKYVYDIQGTTTTMETIFSGYGQPVNITAPPASQIAS